MRPTLLSDSYAIPTEKSVQRFVKVHYSYPIQWYEALEARPAQLVRGQGLGCGRDSNGLSSELVRSGERLVRCRPPRAKLLCQVGQRSYLPAHEKQARERGSSVSFSLFSALLAFSCSYAGPRHWTIALAAGPHGTRATSAAAPQGPRPTPPASTGCGRSSFSGSSTDAPSMSSAAPQPKTCPQIVQACPEPRDPTLSPRRQARSRHRASLGGRENQPAWSSGRAAGPTTWGTSSPGTHSSGSRTVRTSRRRVPTRDR